MTPYQPPQRRSRRDLILGLIAVAALVTAMACCVWFASEAFGAPPAPAPVTRPATQPAYFTPPAPFAGVWCQPADPAGIAKWKARGITAFVGHPDGPAATPAARAAWRAALAAAGLRYLDWPSADPATDLADGRLLAVMLTDEPDDKGVTPAQLAAAAAPYRGKLPVFLNLDLWQQQYASSNHYDYAGAVTACDWLAGDYYPINRADGSTDSFGPRLAALATLAGNRPHFAFIESADFLLIRTWWGNPAMRGPTADEFEAEIAIAKAKGCLPIIFPDVLGEGWLAFDGTTEDVSARMTRLFAPPPVPLPTPAPFDGETVTIRGITYVLRATTQPAH